jgi:adenylate kinase
MRPRRVVIVGVPGVGKSTVVNSVIEMLHSKNVVNKVVNFGSVMMERAARIYSVKSRDDMRKLSVEQQRKLQVEAADEISRFNQDFVIVDTHLFISTLEGFWPGMPLDVLQALKPTNLVLIIAGREEIMKRRESDLTRARDKTTIESLDSELSAATALLFASSLVSGCPALVVSNHDGEAKQAAEKIINAVLRE